jgi:hypothetical protein
MSDISERTTNFLNDLGEAARRNPLSTTLIGVGIVWLFSSRAARVAQEVGRRSRIDQIPDAAGDAFDAAGSALKSTVKSMGSGVNSEAEKAQDGATAALDNARRIERERVETHSGYARSIPESGSEIMQDARANLAELFRAQPLALGAIGLAIGAGIAAALPSTEAEAEYLGEGSDAIKEKVQEFASEQTSRVTAAAESGISAAAEEARKQGLTMEGAKSAAEEMSAKVGRVVDAAGKGVSERVN